MNSQRQKGAAVLALLAILMIVITASLIANVSLNRQGIKQQQNNAALLNRAKEALLGYALRQSPPGLLPCPDSDGDGRANLSGVSCSVQRGFLPYRTLGLDELRDGSGARLWYAVELNYTREIFALRLNSSLVSSMRLNTTEEIAAIVLAPGPVVGNQQRNSNAVAQYLEGINADGDSSTYALVKNDNSNDDLLGLNLRDYWTTIERRVLFSVGQLLTAYKNTVNCDQYPWAANSTAPYDSHVGLEAGLVPTGVATAHGGAVGCPGTLNAPSWVEDHWVTELHYAFCGPAGANCLSVGGDQATTADGLLVAPGTALASQGRPSASLGDYYEGDNNDSDQQFDYFAARNHSDVFNDVLYVFDL